MRSAGSITLDSARRYRLAEARAARLLGLLDVNADLIGAEGQTEVTFEHVRAAAGEPVDRVTVRFRLGEEFGELHVVEPGGSTSVARVYAAGPIERILEAMGFRQVSRAVMVARRYRFQNAEVRVAHVKPLGWFCEIRGEDGANLADVIDALSDAALSAAAVGSGVGPVAGSLEEQRSYDRRRTERRRASLRLIGHDRRTTPERRIGDRRLIALT